MDATSTNTRQERERQFHNELVENDIRTVVYKYHSVLDASRALFKQHLEQLPRGSSVLEYGCGPGSHAFWLAKSGCTVTGIDISDAAIAQAQAEAERQQVADKTTFYAMDAETLTFADESFDCVCGSAIIHHLDIKKSMQEIVRVLKPNGCAVFIEPLGHNPLINLYRTLTPRLRTPDEHPLLVSDLTMMARSFETIETQFFHLTDLVAVPLRNTPLFHGIVAALQGFDRAVFEALPFMRRHAWMSVIRLSHPLSTERFSMK